MEKMEISFEDDSSVAVFNKKVCRVCLKDSSKLKSLYVKKNVDILERLRSFILVEDQTTTELPKWICENCISSLNSAYEFKNLCIQNDNQLRSKLRISKEAKNSEVKEEEEDLNVFLSELVEAKIEEFDIKEESLITGELSSESECELNDDGPDNNSDSEDDSKSSSNEDEEGSDYEESKSELKCKLCNKQFKGKTPLRRHETIVHGDNMYSCHICSKKYRYKKYLESHIEKVHDVVTKIKTNGARTAKCRQCLQHFANDAELRRHRSVHHMPKIHKCEICSKMFKTVQILKTHKIRHLSLEERNKLESVKKYLCPICGKVLYSSSNRDAHVRGHSDDRPWKCTVCYKAFKQKNLLTVHMSKHSDDRPFKCEICGNCFKNQTQFTAHQLTHKLKDMEKQFECKICSVKFRYKLNLTHHTKNIHLGIRNYKCDLCVQAFYTSNLLKQHKAKKHADDGLLM